MIFALFIIIAAALVSFHPPEFYGFDKTPQVYTDKDIYKYEQKILREEEKEKYEKSLLPKSGYMTREEYEAESADITTAERKIPSYETPKEQLREQEYAPEPVYSLVKYNNPPGSPELKIGRKLGYDREFISPGIVSPNKDILVYPVTNYYGASDCVTGDLYVIKLEKSKPEVQRVLDANIIKREKTPILSTSKDLSEKSIFRSLTPVDFSPDGTLLLVKEKIGNKYDGIWQTNVWVYNFRTQEKILLSEIQETIKYYWRNYYGLYLDEKRWDVYPLGFSAKHPDIIIITAYGYTGGIPKFLGTWSVDYKGEYTELVSLSDAKTQISINGYKIKQTGVKDPAIVHNEAKAKAKHTKELKKAEKQKLRAEKKEKYNAYKQKIKEMKAQERETLRKMK